MACSAQKRKWSRASFYDWVRFEFQLNLSENRWLDVQGIHRFSCIEMFLGEDITGLGLAPRMIWNIWWFRIRYKRCRVNVVFINIKLVSCPTTLSDILKPVDKKQFSKLTLKYRFDNASSESQGCFFLCCLMTEMERFEFQRILSENRWFDVQRFSFFAAQKCFQVKRLLDLDLHQE